MKVTLLQFINLVTNLNSVINLIFIIIVPNETATILYSESSNCIISKNQLSQIWTGEVEWQMRSCKKEPHLPFELVALGCHQDATRLVLHKIELQDYNSRYELRHRQRHWLTQILLLYQLKVFERPSTWVRAVLCCRICLFVQCKSHLVTQMYFLESGDFLKTLSASKFGILRDKTVFSKCVVLRCWLDVLRSRCSGHLKCKEVKIQREKTEIKSNNSFWWCCWHSNISDLKIQGQYLSLLQRGKLYCTLCNCQVFSITLIYAQFWLIFSPQISAQKTQNFASWKSLSGNN